MEKTLGGGWLERHSTKTILLLFACEKDLFIPQFDSPLSSPTPPMNIPALIVHQWLPMWDKTKFDPERHREKPQPAFYVFSMSAYDLRLLSGIYARDPNKPPSKDTGIQRRHDAKKSQDVLNYLCTGFPLSQFKKTRQREDEEINSLRMPGWLPGAVVVNILKPGDERGTGKLADTDAITVEHLPAGGASLSLPHSYDRGEGKWAPEIHPIEVIDGQHRLWALTKNKSEQWQDPEFISAIQNFQIPVVAFVGLDITWQAYLFYTINQLPRKVDQNLVFDLYPLLRSQDWLERFEGPNIYRETRAQDLTILLWGHPDSPWYKRIKRLDRKDEGAVSQAAFIRALTNSFIRKWKQHSGSSAGGLFGNEEGSSKLKLRWGREQQAAFLIFVWNEVKEAVVASTALWVTSVLEQKSAGQQHLSEHFQQDDEKSLRAKLFEGKDVSLLAADQGVTAVMRVINDLLWAASELQRISLQGWEWDRKEDHDDNEAISDALAAFHVMLPACRDFVVKIAQGIASFDLRTSSAVPPSDQVAFNQQKIYRGSSGYRDLRIGLFKHLALNGPQEVAAVAKNFSGAFEDEADD